MDEKRFEEAVKLRGRYDKSKVQSHHLHQNVNL